MNALVRLRELSKPVSLAGASSRLVALVKHPSVIQPPQIRLYVGITYGIQSFSGFRL